MWNSAIRNTATRSGTYQLPPCRVSRPLRQFHDYFITHLPSSSLHPDAKSGGGPRHGLPRDKSTPHVPQGSERTPAAPPPIIGVSRETTVVRIPIRSAKHHFGGSVSRGSRPYNEDTYQVGTIDIPTFAKRRPISLTRSASKADGHTPATAGGTSEDTQVFYFGVFDGHGGTECSAFLREELHKYIEDAGKLFELQSSLARKGSEYQFTSRPLHSAEETTRTLNSIKLQQPQGDRPLKPPPEGQGLSRYPDGARKPPESAPSIAQSSNKSKADKLERDLVMSWRELVGGYYKRFKPDYFSEAAGGKGQTLGERSSNKTAQKDLKAKDGSVDGIGLETVLNYAFLKADYDFVSAQAEKIEEDPVKADKPLNDDEILHIPHQTRQIGGPKRFKGGSTCSVALVSTPTPSPFWNPASPSTIITAHVGDTRILLCATATGLPISLTTNHHPSDPYEAARLRRYAATFVTDSFGEERVSGLANTRAFGDMASKRIGVSAEPEIRRMELNPAEYSFMVLVSDGVSGHLSDQEIVDIIKEAKTPDQGAKDVVAFAVEVATSDADNATTLVVRLGGWERRNEGGLGSMGTRELRNWRKQEAESPRGRRM
jgi:protein phosphatase PTC6